MGKSLDPKCKQCRRIGEKLMLKGERCNSPKCAMVKRNYPPGLHGSKGMPRRSDFGKQLAEKQKAKKQYNILEKQFRLTFDKANNQAGNTGENLLVLLEKRLDNVVYRLGFATSRSQARQLVNHGHFTVNGKRVDIPSYTVKDGDIIEIKDSKKKNKYFRGFEKKLKSYVSPGWLNLNVSDLQGKVLHNPAMADINTNISAHMIVEYYSK